jgi:propanol-preferring alcohol dehydrogenase
MSGSLAMVLRRPGTALVAERRELPAPGAGQVRVNIHACAVCRTDLHVVDGELPEPTLPIVPGHEIVGTVEAVGAGVSARVGERVGIPWLGYTCGRCEYCTSGRENLCDVARFTGYQIDGGYAESTLADWRFCLPLPAALDDAHAAPLLCAGLIGYRCLSKAGPARRLGLYGFGAAAHLIAQIARHQGRQVFAFVRPGDTLAADFARDLGVDWVGASDESPPQPLDAAILFAPVGALVPQALRSVRKGGVVVCGGIHMSPIPSFPYDWLWGERQIVSVANLTRADGAAFMRLAAEHPLHVQVQPYPLQQAQHALDDLRAGRLVGAAVLLPPSSPGWGTAT